MVPLFKRTDVPSKAFLSFTQKTLLFLPFVKRFYSSSYCVCVLTCVETKGQCLVSSNILQPIVWDSLPLNLLFALWLASQRAMGIHPSLRCQVLELQMYATMPPPFMGDPQRWSQTLLCGKHFTHQSTSRTVRLSFLWKGKWIQNANAVLRNSELDTISISCSLMTSTQHTAVGR